MNLRNNLNKKLVMSMCCICSEFDTYNMDNGGTL